MPLPPSACCLEHDRILICATDAHTGIHKHFAARDGWNGEFAAVARARVLSPNNCSLKGRANKHQPLLAHRSAKGHFDKNPYPG